MIIKLLNILRKYSVGIAELSVSNTILNKAPSHIGFDIENNIIVGIKLYFKADCRMVQGKYGILTDNLEESISFTELQSNERKQFRWICRPFFEQYPYSSHKETALKLLSEVGCINQYDTIISLADKIQSCTGSKRYPLVGYGAVQDSNGKQNAVGAKFYYTFWQSGSWDSIYANNETGISLQALMDITPMMYNCSFRYQVIDIAKSAIELNNIISMYAINISKDEISEKLYFVTDENMWIRTLSSVHKMIYDSDLDTQISNLFQDIAKSGFRFEEIAYSVKKNKSIIMAYFMI